MIILCKVLPKILFYRDVDCPAFLLRDTRRVNND